MATRDKRTDDHTEEINDGSGTKTIDGNLKVTESLDVVNGLYFYEIGNKIKLYSESGTVDLSAGFASIDLPSELNDVTILSVNMLLTNILEPAYINGKIPPGMSTMPLLPGADLYYGFHLNYIIGARRITIVSAATSFQTPGNPYDITVIYKD